MGLTDNSLLTALPSDDHHHRFTDGACRPPLAEVEKLPKLFDFKYTKTRIQVFTHRSYFARPTAVFEDPPDDIAPDNEVLEFVGDSVLSLAVATLTREIYPGLRVGPHAKIKALVVQNATIAHISEHYLLAQNLRANSSQLVSLRHSPVVQADLFEAYLGGLYVDWGYEYIRPWLFRVLRPYVDEAYRIVQRDYLDPSPGKRSSASKPLKSGSPLSGSPLSGATRTPPFGKPAKSPLSYSQLPETFRTPDTFVGVMTMTPESLPSMSIRQTGHPELPPESPMPSSYSPTMQPSSPTHRFAPSAIAEGHLPLLNQVLQHAKRWIDWDYRLDPKSPSTTPIWDASGKMSGVLVCKGRGNTKKLAKNDAARTLVGELQARLGRSGGTTADLAEELEKWYQEKESQSTIYEQEEEDDQVLQHQFSHMGFGQSMHSRSSPYQSPYSSHYGSPGSFNR